jgi:hypothetical protein
MQVGVEQTLHGYLSRSTSSEPASDPSEVGRMLVPARMIHNQQGLVPVVIATRSVLPTDLHVVHICPSVVPVIIPIPVLKSNRDPLPLVWAKVDRMLPPFQVS